MHSAVLSPDLLYRYELRRKWGLGRAVTFVMLNPSTADASTDDNTIRSCMRLTRHWGWDGIVVVNLFAFRTRSPRHLAAAPFPVGPENDRYVADAIRETPLTIVAWGIRPKSLLSRGSLDVVLASPRGLFCLGTTKDGSPRHPLYLPTATRIEPWYPNEESA